MNLRRIITTLLVNDITAILPGVSWILLTTYWLAEHVIGINAFMLLTFIGCPIIIAATICVFVYVLPEGTYRLGNGGNYLAYTQANNMDATTRIQNENMARDLSVIANAARYPSTYVTTIKKP